MVELNVEIPLNRDMKYSQTAELNKWKLIPCKNPASKKGKLYCLANQGKKSFGDFNPKE